MDPLGILDDPDHIPSENLVNNCSKSEAGHFHRFFAPRQRLVKMHKFRHDFKFNYYLQDHLMDPLGILDDPDHFPSENLVNKCSTSEPAIFTDFLLLDNGSKLNSITSR